jgi:hypothetical protein
VVSVQLLDSHFVSPPRHEGKVFVVDKWAIFGEAENKRQMSTKQKGLPAVDSPRISLGSNLSSGDL